MAHEKWGWSIKWWRVFAKPSNSGAALIVWLKRNETLSKFYSWIEDTTTSQLRHSVRLLSRKFHESCFCASGIRKLEYFGQDLKYVETCSVSSSKYHFRKPRLFFKKCVTSFVASWFRRGKMVGEKTKKRILLTSKIGFDARELVFLRWSRDNVQTLNRNLIPRKIQLI